MSRRNLVVNLAAVMAASVALLLYAVSSLFAATLFSPSYPLSVLLPESGGLLASQEVTMTGRAVGRITEVALDGEGVRVTFELEADERVPHAVDAVVLRRSAVGEQALDLRPREPGPPFYEPGEEIRPGRVVTPVSVNQLLTNADEVFAPVDVEEAGALVGELADTVRGRRDDLRAFMDDSARLSAALADNSADYERLFAQGRVVAEELVEHRETLGRSIGAMADAASILSDMRTEYEGLLAEAPGVLTQAGELVDRGQANLSCTFGHLAGINTYLARPEQLDNAGEALRQNQLFFVAFDILAPKGPDGNHWNRIHFIPPQQPPPVTYLPEKRPIPATLPGGACSSPFGPAAPAANQAGVTLLTPESRIIPPADNRTTPIRVGGAPIGGGGAPRPRGVLPATGGDGLALLGGALLMALAGVGLWRRT